MAYAQLIQFFTLFYTIVDTYLESKIISTEHKPCCLKIVSHYSALKRGKKTKNIFKTKNTKTIEKKEI